MGLTVFANLKTPSVRGNSPTSVDGRTRSRHRPTSVDRRHSTHSLPVGTAACTAQKPDRTLACMFQPAKRPARAAAAAPAAPTAASWDAPAVAAASTLASIPGDPRSHRALRGGLRFAMQVASPPSTRPPCVRRCLSAQHTHVVHRDATAKLQCSSDSRWLLTLCYACVCSNCSFS